MNEHIDQINKDIANAGLGYIMGKDMPVSIFSGADTTCFFNKQLIECFSIKMSKNKMICYFALTDGMEKLLKSSNWIDFDFISVCERGTKGLVTGRCKIIDYEIGMSIDDLGFEVKVEFECNLNKIMGYLRTTEEQQDEISKIYYCDLLKIYTRDKLNETK